MQLALPIPLSHPRLAWAGRVFLAHAAAVATCLLAVSALVTLAYAILFAAAAVTHGPIGSPVGLPIALLLIAAATIGSSAFIFAPATIAGGLVREHRSGWSRWLLDASVTTTAGLVISVVAVALLWPRPWGHTMATAARVQLLVIPGLALYWLSARLSDGAITLATWAWRWTITLWAAAEPR